MTGPDTKPAKRIKDRRASGWKLAADPWCRPCLHLFGKRVRASNTHHLLGRGQRGDDLPENLIPMCGHGSAGCHGALHGNPYESPLGGRVTAQDVRQAIGLNVRPPEVAYLVWKLGEPAAIEYLLRFYHVRVNVKPFLVEPALEVA